MRLKPHAERPPADQIIADLRPKLAAIPGFRVYPQNLPTIRIGGSLTKALYQYTLQATDLRELYQWGPIVFDKMRTLPGFQDVNTDLQITSPQVTVDIDRDKASALGVSAEQIENALYSAYGSRQVSTIYTPTNQYWVILELDPAYQRDPTELSLLYVRSQSGKLVPLNSVARLTPTIGPLTITHLGQLPSVTISFNLAQGVALSQAVDLVGMPGHVPKSYQPAERGAQPAQAFEAEPASEFAELAYVAVESVLARRVGVAQAPATQRDGDQMEPVLERRRFLRVAGVELAIMVVIVGVTAVLVNSEPSRTMAMEMEAEAGEHETMDGTATPFEGSVMLGDMEAMVMVDPAAPGDNTITITFMDAEELPTEVSVSASLPSQQLGPLDFPGTDPESNLATPATAGVGGSRRRARPRTSRAART